MNYLLNSYLEASWNAPSHIRAYTTLRTEGSSQEAYHSFNLADHVGDDASAVKKNRQKLCKDLQLQQEPLWLTQVHGREVVCWDKNLVLPQKFEADASFTQWVNHPCVALTADCLPVVICNREGTMVAAIHAGWKGILNGVIEATVEKMCASAGRGEKNEWLAWMGPAIGQAAFEIDEDVRDQFVQADLNAENAFKPGKSGKWHGDIFLLGKQRLQSVGVNEVTGGYICTYQEKENFFSARRDKTTGRMATLIWIGDSTNNV